MLQKTQSKGIKITEALPIFTMAILSVILFCGNVFAINTSKFIDLICVVTFPFFDVSGLMMITAFLIPVNSGITTLYIFGYIVVLLVVKGGKLHMREILPLLAIVGYELILIAVYGQFEILKYVQYVEVLFLFVYGLSRDRLEYRKICYSYIFGVILLLIAVLATASQTYGFEEVINGEIRIGYNEDFESLGGSVALIQDNANNIGYFSVLASTMCMLLAKDVKWIGKTLLWTAFVLIVLIASFTISRTWLFLTIAGVVLAVLLGYRGKARLAVLAVLVAAVVVISFLFLSDSEIVRAFSDRLNTIEQDERGLISLKYLKYLGDNPLRILFGTGAVYYKEVTTLTEALHFGFLQILVSYGVFGFAFWMWLMFSPIFRHFISNKKSKVYKLIPLVLAVIFVQTIQFLNPFVLMLPYMIAICYMKIPEKEESLPAL